MPIILPSKSRYLGKPSFRNDSISSRLGDFMLPGEVYRFHELCTMETSYRDCEHKHRCYEDIPRAVHLVISQMQKYGFVERLGRGLYRMIRKP